MIFHNILSETNEDIGMAIKYSEYSCIDVKIFFFYMGYYYAL